MFVYRTYWWRVTDAFLSYLTAFTRSMHAWLRFIYVNEVDSICSFRYLQRLASIHLEFIDWLDFVMFKCGFTYNLN